VAKEHRGVGTGTLSNSFQRNIHVVCQRGRKHRVLHIVHRAPFDRRRHQVRPQEGRMRLVIVNTDHVAIHTLLQHEGLAACLDVLFYQRMCRVHRHVTDAIRFSIVRHLQAECVISIQNSRILGNLYWHTLDLGELLKRIDTAQPEVIRADIQAGADVGLLETKAAA
jgi:hypothetical protein